MYEAAEMKAKVQWRPQQIRDNKNEKHQRKLQAVGGASTKERDFVGCNQDVLDARNTNSGLNISLAEFWSYPFLYFCSYF